MIIINTEFSSNVISALENCGFSFDETSDAKFRFLNHEYIPGLRVQYRELHGRIKIGITGQTILSIRNIEYYDSDPKAINNLRSRLNRIVRKEDDAFAVRDNRERANRSKKELMANKIRAFNSLKGGHSIVVDEDSLEDAYASLQVYYRSYEFNVHMDEEGLIYTRQSILNKPSEDLSVLKITAVIDALVK